MRCIADLPYVDKPPVCFQRFDWLHSATHRMWVRTHSVSGVVGRAEEGRGLQVLCEMVSSVLTCCINIPL